MSDWLNEEQAADYLGISPRSIRNMRNRKILRFTKIGRIVRYHKNALDEAFEKYQHNAV